MKLILILIMIYSQNNRINLNNNKENHINHININHKLDLFKVLQLNKFHKIIKQHLMDNLNM